MKYKYLLQLVSKNKEFNKGNQDIIANNANVLTFLKIKVMFSARDLSWILVLV